MSLQGKLGLGTRRPIVAHGVILQGPSQGHNKDVYRTEEEGKHPPKELERGKIRGKTKKKGMKHRNEKIDGMYTWRERERGGGKIAVLPERPGGRTSFFDRLLRNTLRARLFAAVRKREPKVGTHRVESDEIPAHGL